MNNALKISLLANLALVALVLWLAQHMRVSTESGLMNATAEESSAPVSQPASSIAPPEPQRKFHWSQLESSDYPTYIANLRAIGCPRQTIRDLIVADVDSVYAARRGQLLREQAANPAAGPAAHQAMQNGLRQLQDEETTLLLALLGPPPGAPAVTAAGSPASPAPIPARRSRFQDQSVSLPLVFQDAGPELKLDANQLAVFNDLRESFNQEFSGLNLDPADPEYRRRWQKARREADEMLSALLGEKFALSYQRQAADQPPAPKK